MPGGTESKGTGVGELPSLVLGIATRYRIFFDLVLVNFPHLYLEQHFVHLIWILVNLHLLFLFSYAQCGVHHLLVGMVQ